VTAPAELDLSPLQLPPAEEGLLRLLLTRGACSSGSAAGKLGLSVPQVSSAAAGLRERGFVVAGRSRSQGHVLAPLRPPVAALLVAARQESEARLSRLEDTAQALLATSSPAPPSACPHYVVPRDVLHYERIRAGHRARRRLDVVVDRFHVNAHVPALGPPTRFGPKVRLLVTAAADDRPLVVNFRWTDARAAARGLKVRRHPDRCAAFAVHDDKRVEIPLWHSESTGWSTEPGEVRAAARLFELLWAEATPYGPAPATAVRLRPAVGSAP
jgi:hypothetical protein